MKVAVTAQGKDLDSPLDPRFGRCQYFLIVDLETGQLEAVPNEAVQASSGAGIRGAQLLSDRGVSAVVTGNVGPNAVRALHGARIEIFTSDSGTVRDALDRFKEGEPPLSRASCPPGG